MLSKTSHSATDEPAAVAAAPVHRVAVERWTDGVVTQVVDQLAEEVPVALTYHGIPHVVMLSTPTDVADLAVGFTLSEGIARIEEILSVEALQNEDGSLEARIGIAAPRFSELLRRQRNLTGRTGCGLCGTRTVEDAIRQLQPVTGNMTVTADQLHAALADLRRWQTINASTGSVHAAAWVLPNSGIQLAREDVGRHNALDKVIGAVARFEADFSKGYFLVTSRASYEMVQKAAAVGSTFLAAVSAPTAFAVRLANSTGLTLVGFAREHQHVTYAHSARLIG